MGSNPTPGANNLLLDKHSPSGVLLAFSEEFPPRIWSAPCLATGPIPHYFEPEVIMPPHILKEKRLYTFVDLSKDGNVFSGVDEDYNVKSVNSEEWFHDDVHSRWLVQLLGWGIDSAFLHVR